MRTSIEVITKKIKVLLSLLIIASINMAMGGSIFAAERAKVVVIATGGTIAGSANEAVTTAYKPAQLTVKDIIASVDGVEKLAEIEAVQFSNISSQNMSSDMLIKLADFVNKTVAREDVSGVVITHGTDTMEESAYFLSLTVGSSKPVIFVGSMRPSTALSGDGPVNLYSAISTAASDEAKGRGAMVVMNDKIFAARDVTKSNTLNVDAYSAPNSSPIGVIDSGRPFFLQPKSRGDVFTSIPSALPKVMVLYGYVDADAEVVDFAVDKGYKGIVYCGVGHGNMNDATMEKLVEASKNGVAVVRSSRVYSGLVTSQGEIDDQKYGFTSSGVLNSQKARLLLALSLAKAATEGGGSEKAIKIFDSMKY